MIKPTIGRQVWFKPDPVNVPELTHAATVVCVHSDTCVNLAVLDSYGELYQRRSVELVQPGCAEPAMPFCHWMPYQVTAAAWPPVVPLVDEPTQGARVLTDADAAADLAGMPRPDAAAEVQA